MPGIALFLVEKLFHRLKCQNGTEPLTWDQRATIALGTATGLSHLHRRQILHLNIRASNIFLDENLSPKIGIPLSKDYLVNLNCEDVPAHLPRRDVMKQENLNFSTDVYSFGIFLFCLVTGEHIDMSHCLLQIHYFNCFKKWAYPGLLFILSNTHYKFYNKYICEKMSIQYMVPGFELITFAT